MQKIIDNSGIIVLVIVGLAIVVFGTKIYLKSRRRIVREADLDMYWDNFMDDAGCPIAKHYCLDGLNIHRHYGVPLPCASEEDYISAAIKSLETRIKWQEDQFAVEGKSFINEMNESGGNAQSIIDFKENHESEIMQLRVDRIYLRDMLAEYKNADSKECSVAV